MRERYLSLILVAALFATKAISQEIVIEPTNGRPQSTNRVSRPAAEPSTPAEPKIATRSVANSADQHHSKAKATAKKPRTEQIAVKREATPVPAKATETINNEAADAASAPKKMPEGRPAWAMADTRDAGALQNEISSALAHDAKLAGSAIQVSVNDNSVTLEGHVAGNDEHLQAQRLAKSYAWNRKLVDHIEVAPSMSAQK